MKNYTRYLAVLLFINGAFLTAKSGEKTTESNPQIIEKMDSLTNAWYVKRALSNMDVASQDSSSTDTIISFFPDSVYIKRIKAMNSYIDLTYNKIVRNFIHVYTHKKVDKLRVILGLKDHYFPMFEEILDSYQLPLELKYMAVIESALIPNAVSRAGATGLWQFIYGTGKLYGLTINTVVDERRDPIRSTHAAANYLMDLYNIYQDWFLVIAAYNCGPTNVNKAIRRSGGKRDYWEAYYYLPRETRGYVPAFIAAMYAMTYHKEHNITPIPVKMPVALDTVEVNQVLHLEQVSKVLQIPMKQLKELNPQYRRNIIPAKDKKWVLRLPMEYSGRFVSLQDSIYGYKDSVYFAKDLLKNPASYRRSSYKHAKPKGNYTKLYYTVQPGDNLGYIAEWYNVRASEIRYWNNIRGNLIRHGQKLIIYVPKNKYNYYKEINSLSFAQKQKRVGAPIPDSHSSGKVPATKGADDSYVYYKVDYGDTIWEIARKFSGVSDLDIMRLNNIRSGKSLKVGQVIKIKKK